MTQKKITEVFEDKQRTLSFEFYPPKTDKGRAKLINDTAPALEQLGADYFSVTYGAGGSQSRTTLSLVEDLLADRDVPIMHHLTCIKHTFASVRAELEEMKDVGVRNIMALRGDPPADDPGYVPGPDQPRYGCDLVSIIREYGDWFSVGVPGFPEVHPLAETPEVDTKVLRVKQDNGADFCVTQLFFEPGLYEQYVRRMRSGGVEMRLIPGILPVTNYVRLLEFCEMCGATVPQSIRHLFEPIADEPEKVMAQGIASCVELCKQLLAAGAPGIHFYCLNKTEPVTEIVNQLEL
jgi:methylenetetrahydrofolate reductase (NADPH)